jgi:hypothetical protein
MRRQVLEPLGRDEPARYQRYDWDADRLAEWHEIPVGGTVIIERLVAMAVPVQVAVRLRSVAAR